ncbi:MAG TPA: 50S ribosomal protein L18 [Spirochaetota bacterium]|nr:50S ribosomal protein L18 [Spirochaetota bacterium]
MLKVELGKKRRARRKLSIRRDIFGTSSKPRLSVFRSNKYIYVQAIDDDAGKTIASASSLSYDHTKFKLNKKTAEKVGEDIALKLKKCNIDTVVFDRNGFLYTGKIKVLADSARKNGLKF